MGKMDNELFDMSLLPKKLNCGNCLYAKRNPETNEYFCDDRKRVVSRKKSACKKYVNNGKKADRKKGRIKKIAYIDLHAFNELPLTEQTIEYILIPYVGRFYELKDGSFLKCTEIKIKEGIAVFVNIANIKESLTFEYFQNNISCEILPETGNRCYVKI